MENATLEEALRLAELGYRVLPCAPGGKPPILKAWQDNSSSDEATINAWWNENPGANLGVYCGGLCVVDVDGKDNPWLTPEIAVALNVGGPIQRTPGGRHYLFRQPAGADMRNTAGEIAKDVDTRANGGFIIVAPSVVGGKSYGWAPESQLDRRPDRLPIVPQFILAALAAGEERKRGASNAPAANAAAGVIPEGERDNTLISMAGGMRYHGFGHEAILSALRLHNAEQCKPPLDDTAVAKIARSAMRYAPGEKQPVRYEAGAAIWPASINMDDVETEQVAWFWPKRIPLGKLTLLVGDPGLGKSFLALDLASRASNGAKWPDCDAAAPAGSIVLLSAEDGLGDTIKPRLQAAGANMPRITSMTGVAQHEGQTEGDRAVNLKTDLDAIEKLLEGIPDCKLLVVDPISAYMGDVDSHNNTEVRGLLAPLSSIAAKHGVAVLAVSHLRKGDGQAVHRPMGSLAFIAAARAGYVVTRDPNDPSGERRLMLPIKNNLGDDKTGMAFSLVPRFDGSDAPYVLWDAIPVETSANEAMAPPAPGPKSLKKDAAAEYLAEALESGPRACKELYEEAREVHAIAKRTLERAKQELEVVAYRESVPGPWFWRLPDDSANARQPDACLGNLGDLGGAAGAETESSDSAGSDAELVAVPF